MLRKGKTFWQTLGDYGFRSTIFRMPVNFPPVKAAGRALAGGELAQALGGERAVPQAPLHEGDVVLDMIFLSNGSIQVIRVISGLGHGLDEAASRAAQQIKFKPARRDGQPVDFPARVRIEFRLAY